MLQVFVPPMLRQLTDGADIVRASGANLGAVLDDLEKQFPGFRARVCRGDEIRPELSVWLNDEICSRGLAEPIPTDGEIHFLPALGGGC